MPQPLVCESWRCKQLQTFDLTEMCPLAEGEQVEELRDVVAPVSRNESVSASSLSDNLMGGRASKEKGQCRPYARIVTLFTEACSYGGALFLDDGALVCNGLGGPDVADELLH